MSNDLVAIAPVKDSANRVNIRMCLLQSKFDARGTDDQLLTKRRTDRHISQLLEQQNSIVESLNEMRQAMNQLAARTGNADAGSMKLMSPPEFGTGELAGRSG